jgi:hypothetical protein
MNESRSALIVASQRYRDPKLRRLRAPTHDAKALSSVLADPDIGGFDVDVSLDEPEHTVRRKLAGFFKTRGRDDLLLLHFSCHGVKDEDGNLYFATPDTELEHLDATAVPAEFVNRLMNRSPSRRIVLLLDCCYAGAFGKGAVHRAGDNVDLKERFDGRGRVVLTASTSMEYAFEGDSLKGEGTPSIFTSALVAGLQSGQADRDRDGFVSIDELYDYLYDRVREETPNQTPSKWTYDVQGDLVVARNPEGATVTPADLPDALMQAMESPIPYVREGTVQALSELLRGHSATLALAARIALEDLRGDDSRRVSLAAEEALVEAAPHVRAPTPAEPARTDTPKRAEPPASTARLEEKITSTPPTEPARPVPTPRPTAPVRAPGGRRTNLVVAAAAVGGALLLVAVGPIVFSGEYHGSARALLVEPLFLALLAPLVAVAWARAWLGVELGLGLLLGLAVQVAAAAIGWLGASAGPSGLLRDTDSNLIGLGRLPLFFALGAVAVVAAAAVAAASAGARLLTSVGLEARRPTLVPAGVSLAGVSLCLAALFLPFRNEVGDRHAIWSEGAISGPWVVFEPVGVLVGVVAASLLGLVHGMVRAGALFALGIGLFLYFATYTVSVHYHAPGAYGPGGIIGVFGGIAILAAAAQLRAARTAPAPAATA